jgi:hypothetical protein
MAQFAECFGGKHPSRGGASFRECQRFHTRRDTPDSSIRGNAGTVQYSTKYGVVSIVSRRLRAQTTRVQVFKSGRGTRRDTLRGGTAVGER